MEDQIDLQFYWSYEIAAVYLKSAELIRLVLVSLIYNN